MKKKFNIIALLLLAALIIIQFFGIDKTNPVSDPTQDIFATLQADNALVLKIREACYDCHSNNTHYPWYASVQPVGWWLKGHVNEAREHLNFSEFGTYTDEKAKHKLEEAVEYTEEGKMPLKSFTITHPEARLTDLERATMVTWFQKQYDAYE